MTVYARSDVVCVALSKEHGGCGATHTRPVTHGSPMKVWGLDCLSCEDHLRHDPHWATSPMEIPETPDEIRIREEQEKRGEQTQKANMENAVASLAATADGFQKLMAMMFASNPDMMANMTKMMEAANAGATSSSMDNAAEMLAASPTMENVNAHREAVGLAPFVTEPAKLTAEELSSFTVKDLKAAARDRGLPDTGTRAELIERIAAA